MRLGSAVAAMSLLAGLAAAPVEPATAGASQAPPPAPPPSPMAPAELRDLFEKAEKVLSKASDAATGTDAGRVSHLLRRTDEEIGRFENASGLAPLIEAVDRSREAAGRNELPAAEAALRRARPWISSLSDYTVPRSAEVAIRAAQGAASDGNPHDFLASLDRLEDATLAPFLLASLREARAAVARGRALLVRGDLKGGSQEIGAARSALDGLTYAGALSQSHFSFLVASELLRDRALLAARDQAQKGLRALRQAVPLAPPPARDSLQRILEDTTAVWKRINRAAAGDADLLAAASDAVDEKRRQLRAFRPSGVVAK